MSGALEVVALDLEGTLISNAMSQFPRPGLIAFLETCRREFGRVVIFTAVSTARARRIVELLAHEGSAPAWFAQVEIVEWSGEHKDLRFVPGAEVERAALVDDLAQYVLPGQEHRWIAIAPFEAPYPDDDRGLEAALDALRALAPDASSP